MFCLGLIELLVIGHYRADGEGLLTLYVCRLVNAQGRHGN